MNDRILSRSIKKARWWGEQFGKIQCTIPNDLNVENPVNYYFEPVFAEKNLLFDANGIRACALPGSMRTVYSPTLVFDFGMRAYQKYMRSGDSYWRARWLLHADWAVENQQNNGSMRGGWEFGFDLPDVGAKSPFLNASAQGLALSLLSRTWLETGMEKYRDAAEKAVAPFTKLSGAGGVCILHKEKHRFFETYPSSIRNYILGGHIRALLGLRDMSIYTGCEPSHSLMVEGMETLKSMLPLYDLGYWSRYSLRKGFVHVACLSYHMDLINYLRVLVMITKEQMFSAYSAKFEHYAKSRICHLMAFSGKTAWRLPRLKIFTEGTP